MKKKNKKKKFQDLDTYNKELLIKKQNDDTFSKDDYKDKNNSKDNKMKKEFNSCLEELIFIFPNFSPDFITEFYEDNDKNYSRTKENLIKLSEEELRNDKNITKNENKINDNDYNINEPLIKDNKNENKNKSLDITHLAKFEIADNNEYIENIDEKENNEKKNYMKFEKEQENKDYHSLLDLKDKNKNEYYSIFNDETNNNYNKCNNNYSQRNEVMIDDYLFDQNIEFLYECFPGHSREEIIQKICDNNFDIDEVASNLLNEANLGLQQNEEDLANLEITDKDEILSNFLNFENGAENDFDFELFQESLVVQKEIEESIKKENNKKQNNINNIYEDEITDSEENKINDNKENKNEEFFLYKKIEDIKTPKIKEDLKKLIKHFPLENEFLIRLVYYQYMNYNVAYQYFNKKDDTKYVGLKGLLNSINNDKKFANSKNAEVKKYNNKNNQINKYEFSEEKKQFEIFKKIIDKKPINWKLEEDNNYNLNDYVAVRKRLFFEAKKAYANQQYKNGQILMAKAKRYKQEFDKIYQNHKYHQFAQNNDKRNNNEIDLHGLNVKESKYIIDQKIKSLNKKKIENNLKSISLTIITGSGSHSAGHKAVLYPNLMDWLKNRDKLSAKGDLSQGIIFVTLF